MSVCPSVSLFFHPNVHPFRMDNRSPKNINIFGNSSLDHHSNKNNFFRALNASTFVSTLSKIYLVWSIVIFGSVYFVVKTALSANTKRKCRMAEKETASNYSSDQKVERLKTPYFVSKMFFLFKMK